MKTTILRGFFCLLASSSLSLAGPIAPTSPDVLLAAAPLVPPEWKKAVSRGQSLLSGSGVPVSIATRVYDIEIPVKDAPPKKAQVTVNMQDQGSDFALVENSFGEAAKILSLFGHKAAVLPMGESSTLLQMNIPPRLGMSIIVQGLSNDEAIELLKKIDPSAFIALSKRLPDKRYRGLQFTLAVVDEMDPRRNGKYLHGLVDDETQKPDQTPDQ